MIRDKKALSGLYFPGGAFLGIIIFPAAAALNFPDRVPSLLAGGGFISVGSQKAAVQELIEG